jgi:HK97 family phage portal protein
MARTILIHEKQEPPTRRFRDRVRDGARVMIDAIQGSIRAYKLGTMPISDPNIAHWLNAAPPVASGVHVNHHSALATSAFYCCVDTISSDSAGLPICTYRELSQGGSVKVPNHPASRLLRDSANVETTGFAFRRALMMNTLTFGSGFAEIQRDQIGRPAALWNITSDRVVMERDSAGTLRYRVRQFSGGDVYMEAGNMLHVSGPSFDGLTALDPVMLAREAIGLALAAEKFGARFFNNGSQLSGVLTPGAGLSEQAMENLRRTLDARHQGADAAWKWLLAAPGSTFQAIGVTPQESQLTELRMHQVRDICRFYKVPPSIAGDLQRSNFANFSQEIMKYFASCLRNWLTNLEAEYNNKLLTPSERERMHIEHATAGFLRSDPEQRSAYYVAMVSNGLMTPNEIRALENLPPVEGGDVCRAPLNSAPIAEQQPQSQTGVA